MKQTVKQHSHTNSIALTALTGLAFLSVPILISSFAHAEGDSVVDEISITVPASCTMDATGNNSHNANIANGTYDSNIGQTDIKAFCNDNGGFSIYAIGFTNNEYGKNVLTNETLGTANDIITGTNISGDTSNWAMKLTKLTSPTPTYPIIIAGSTEDSLKQTNDPDFSNFTNIPDTYTKVAYRTAGTDINPEGQPTAEGTTLSTVYQAYISKTQPAGTYTGQVKYTLVHPYTEEPLQPQTTQTGKICYYANAKDAEGTMGCQTIPASGTVDGVTPTSATLLASNFSRVGYGFAGWSDKFDYETNSSAKFYGPNEAIAFTEGQYTGDNKGLSLYAVWVKSQGNLQDSTKVAEVCGSLTAASSSTVANLSSVSALTDQRDGNTYAIAKLADGNCWMIENLRLESADTVGNNRFDSSITNQSLAQGYGGQFVGLANAEPAWRDDITTANSLYSTDGANGTISISTSNAGYRFPRYNNINTPANPSDRPQNPTSNSFINNSTTVGMYSYGNYYSWHATIADTTTYSSGDHNTTSICPTGWKIPLGNTSTGNIEQGASDVANKVPGFSYLDRKMGGTGQRQSTTAASLRWRKFPNNFVYSGGVANGSVLDRGSNGNYWSSTASSSYIAYSLLLTSSNVYPGTGGNMKYNGWTVRCVVSGV